MAKPTRPGHLGLAVAAGGIFAEGLCDGCPEQADAEGSEAEAKRRRRSVAACYEPPRAETSATPQAWAMQPRGRAVVAPSRISEMCRGRHRANGPRTGRATPGGGRVADAPAGDASTKAPASHVQTGPGGSPIARERVAAVVAAIVRSVGGRVRSPYGVASERATESRTRRAASPSSNGCGSESAKIWFGRRRRSSPSGPSTTSARWSSSAQEKRARNEDKTRSRVAVGRPSRSVPGRSARSRVAQARCTRAR